MTKVKGIGENRMLVVIAPEKTGCEADNILGPASGNARLAIMRTIAEWPGTTHVVYIDNPTPLHYLNPISIVTQGAGAVEHTPEMPVTPEAIVTCIMPENDTPFDEFVITGAWADEEGVAMVNQVHRTIERKGYTSRISDCCFRMPQPHETA